MMIAVMVPTHTVLLPAAAPICSYNKNGIRCGSTGAQYAI
jgi:hypothetical protein